MNQCVPRGIEGGGRQKILDDFQQRMSEGGWMPEPKVDANGKVIELLLRRGEGPAVAPAGAMPAFLGDADRWRGSRLPDFAFSTLRGRPVTTTDEKGKVTVLNFWFRGCKPCMMEIPELNELVEQFDGQDVDFLAFSRDSDAEAREAVSKTQFAYKVVPDSGNFHSELGVVAYPTHLVFDREGICVAAYQGYAPGIAQSIASDVQRALED